MTNSVRSEGGGWGKGGEGDPEGLRTGRKEDGNSPENKTDQTKSKTFVEVTIVGKDKEGKLGVRVRS